MLLLLKKYARIQLIVCVMFLAAYLLPIPSANAFTTFSRFWNAKSATFRIDSSVFNLGGNWATLVRLAQADWNSTGLFTLTEDSNSQNVVRAASLSSPAYVVTNPFFGGALRTSADIVINTNQLPNMYSGLSSAVTSNRPDFLTIMRHEFGHFIGLGHTMLSPSNIMYPNPPSGIRLPIDSDARNGVEYIYNVLSSYMPEGPGPNGYISGGSGLNQESSPQVVYRSNGWTPYGWSFASGGSIMQSSQTYATVEYWVQGGDVSHIYSLAPGRGVVDVSIDGVYVDYYNAQYQDSRAQVAKTWTVSTNKPHLVRLVQSSGKIDIDAVVVNESWASNTALQDVTGSNSTVKLYGSWPLEYYASAYDGTLVSTNVLYNQAIIKCYCSGLIYMYTGAPGRGIADIFVDGVRVDQVDGYYGSGNTWQNTRSIWMPSGWGYHTINIVRTGFKNPSSSGYKIDVDAIGIQ